MYDRRYSPEFIAGISNGIVQNVVGHPFDTVKVLLQNKVNLNNIRITDLYRGFKYPLFNQIISNSVALDTHAKLKKLGIKNEFINGGITGAIITPFAFVFDIFKIKSQTGFKYSFNDFIKPTSFALTGLREIPAYSLYLGSYFEMRKYDINPALAGGLAGCINWTATYPLDTIRTRYITFRDIELIECILMRKYWNGYGVCMLRAFLVSSFGFSAYEYTLKFLKNI